MIEIVNKIKALIAQGENSVVEFKASGVHADSIAREMVAYGNSQGGVILLGVDDIGSLEGLDNSRPWEEWIANISRHNIVPPLASKYVEVVISGKRIGYIEVEKGEKNPIRQTGTSLLCVSGQLTEWLPRKRNRKRYFRTPIS